MFIKSIPQKKCVCAPDSSKLLKPQIFKRLLSNPMHSQVDFKVEKHRHNFSWKIPKVYIAQCSSGLHTKWRFISYIKWIKKESKWSLAAQWYFYHAILSSSYHYTILLNKKNVLSILMSSFIRIIYFFVGYIGYIWKLRWNSILNSSHMLII